MSTILEKIAAIESEVCNGGYDFYFHSRVMY